MVSMREVPSGNRTRTKTSLSLKWVSLRIMHAILQAEGCQKLHVCPRKPETVCFFLRSAPEEKPTVTVFLSILTI
jgi:hypothetical protein